MTSVDNIDKQFGPWSGPQKVEPDLDPNFFVTLMVFLKYFPQNLIMSLGTACLVVNPITIGSFAFLFNCTLVGWTLDSMTVPT